MNRTMSGTLVRFPDLIVCWLVSCREATERNQTALIVRCAFDTVLDFVCVEIFPNFWLLTICETLVHVDCFA